MKCFTWIMLVSLGSIHVSHSMESPKIAKVGAWFDTNQEVKITLNGKKDQKCKFGVPYIYQNRYYRGDFEKNGKPGFYKIVNEVYLNESYFYHLIAQLNDNTESIDLFWGRIKNIPPNPTTFSIATSNCKEFPLSARIEFFNDCEQYEIAANEAYTCWNNHSCPPTDSYWRVWCTHTTLGKCISGIGGLLMLYGTARILWDTQEHWKKGGAYLFALIKKMTAKKRKRRKKGRKKIISLQERA